MNDNPNTNLCSLLHPLLFFDILSVPLHLSLRRLQKRRRQRSISKEKLTIRIEEMAKFGRRHESVNKKVCPQTYIHIHTTRMHTYIILYLNIYKHIYTHLFAMSGRCMQLVPNLRFKNNRWRDSLKAGQNGTSAVHVVHPCPADQIEQCRRTYLPVFPQLAHPPVFTHRLRCRQQQTTAEYNIIIIYIYLFIFLLL